MHEKKCPVDLRLRQAMLPFETDETWSALPTPVQEEFQRRLAHLLRAVIEHERREKGDCHE